MKNWSWSLVLLVGLAWQQPLAAQYKIGNSAKVDFALKNASNTINGLNKNVNLSTDYKNNKGLVVIFTCNHCPVSKAYEDRIIALHNKLAPMGYPVVAINPNDPAEYEEDSYPNMVKRAQEKAFPFAYLWDNTQEIAKLYGATRTPHVFVLNKEKAGYVLRYMGAIDDNSYEETKVKQRYVQTAIEKLAKGEKVTLSETKSVGCSIKWKKS